MRLGRRVGLLEAKARARGTNDEPAALVLMPDRWPEEEQAIFEAANDAGDAATCFDIIARQEGVRPGPTTLLIALRVRRDGPQ